MRHCVGRRAYLSWSESNTAGWISVEVIKSLAELELKIAECNGLLTNESDDAMRRLFNTFRMDFSADAPGDPFSDAYRDHQMAIYRALVGKPYVVANERSHFDTAGKVLRPFPYYLQSSWTAGHHLLAIGFMLCKLDLAAGARIVEFGPGWGNTTIELARLGFEVTAVDIDPNFCEVIRLRAEHMEVPVKTVEADFFWTETIEQPYDAALFFASFHHCDDHLRLLRALHRAVKPGGSVYLASEPIAAHYGTPWGIRMDGEALWAARNFGWLELGYDEDYFREALTRTGWVGMFHDCETVPWARVWQLRRAGEVASVEPTTVEPENQVVAMMGGSSPLSALAGEQAVRELAAVYGSTSWRVTRPMRAIRRLLRGCLKTLACDVCG